MIAVAWSAFQLCSIDCVACALVGLYSDPDISLLIIHCNSTASLSTPFTSLCRIKETNTAGKCAKVSLAAVLCSVESSPCTIKPEYPPTHMNGFHRVPSLGPVEACRAVTVESLFDPSRTTKRGCL
ncbi:hypothetical protein Micbo1qcDRAFT_169427, partial [Microdochium bolleyi]